LSTIKTCRKCGETKQINLFYKTIGMSDGYRNICCECEKIRMRKYWLDVAKGRRKAIKQSERECIPIRSKK